MASNIDHLICLAAECERHGNFAPLRDALVKARITAPSEPVLLLLTGMTDLKEGNLSNAERLIGEVVARAPGIHDSHVVLASIYGAQGRHADAFHCLAKAAKRFPSSPPILQNLGIAAIKTRNFKAAEHALSTGTKLSPNDPTMWHLHAQTCVSLEQNMVAQASAQMAHRLRPTRDTTLLLGKLYLKNGRPDLARNFLNEANANTPGDVAILMTLGEACHAASFPEEAALHWRAAAPHLPVSEQPWLKIGTTELVVGNYQAGMKAIRHAAKSDPTKAAAIALATALPVIPQSVAEIEEARANYLAQVSALTENVTPSETPDTGCGTFFLAYHGKDNRDYRRAYSKLLQASISGLETVAPHCRRRHSTPRRPKVGFVSAHLFDHTIIDLFAPFCRALPPQQYETFMFFPPGPADNVRALLARYAEHAVVLPDEPLRARKIIADARLDLLVFLDIGMSEWDLLAYSRLAPRQAMLFGHPETTGIQHVDYFLTAGIMEPPDSATHYWEQAISMSGPGCAYTPAAGIPFDVPAAPRERYNLPETGPLYICPQSLFKLHPDFDRTLAQILVLDPAASIILLGTPFETMAGHIRRRLANVVGDDLARIRFLPFVPKPEFPALLAACDVMLDAFHYSGGHTSLTGFAVGLPIVTMPGEFMRGRHTQGFYEVIGYRDLIATNEAEYVQKAVGIANGGRAHAVSDLRDARAPLFDHASASAAFAQSIADILARPTPWC